jgi:hypothetical protein
MMRLLTRSTSRRLLPVICVMLTLPLAACSDKGEGTGPDGGSLRWTGDEQLGGDGGEFGMGQPGVKPGEVVGFGSITVCVDGGGGATIDSVHFQSATDISIKGFAVRKLIPGGAAMVGIAPGGITVAGFPAENSTVTTTCKGSADSDASASSGVTELGVDVTAESLTPNSSATGKTLILDYHVGDHRGKAEIPVTLKLCAAAGIC